jgi:hypothetical protein
MIPRKKRIYLSGLFGVFIIVIPSLILFSSGYRVNSKFHLVKTGGIYFENNESDIIVKLDGKSIKKAGRFEKNLFIRNLTPKTYRVTVEKVGYRTWKKNVIVEEQKVEVCYPLLIPLELNPQFVPKYLNKGEVKGKKKREANEEYLDAMKLFSVYNEPAKGAIPLLKDSDIKKYKLGASRWLIKKVLLFRQKNKIYVEWTGMDQKRPFFINSSGKQLAFSPDKNILSFGFFPGRRDSMLVLFENLDLYAVEIDTRFGPHNIYKIASNCSRFAAEDEFLYYSSGGSVYRIDLES